ncbi:hypothetical protein A3740_23060, partial [Oleiphilus sp. HI0068]
MILPLPSKRHLLRIWLALLALTLLSVLTAETADFGQISVVIVCVIVTLKGRLVIDEFIGLRHAHPKIRKVMLGYFYLIPTLIVLGVIFPGVIISLTSL